MKNIGINTEVADNAKLSIARLKQKPFKTGSLTVHYSQNLVRLNGNELTLQPKVLDLLIIFCAANGKTLSKQHLVDVLWPDVIVGPDSLANTMARLRKVLGDDSKSPFFIKTVQRKGYVWLPSVAFLDSPRKAFNIRHFSVLSIVLLSMGLLFVLTKPEPKAEKFPFPDLAIQKLDDGGYEIKVGLDSELTEESKAAMLAELKRITGEEDSDMVFTVDEVEPKCLADKLEPNEQASCHKNNANKE